MIGKLAPAVLKMIEELAPRLRSLKEPLNSRAVEEALTTLSTSPAQQWLPGFSRHQFPDTIPLGHAVDASVPELADRFRQARFQGFNKLVPGTVPNREQGWHDYGGPLDALAVEEDTDPVRDLLLQLWRVAETDRSLRQRGIKGRGPQWRIDGD